MTNRLLLALICTWITTLTHAQPNKYSLDACARDYYTDSLSAPDQKQAALRSCMIGKPFPAFSATTVTGRKYTDADLKGKVVFVTSWFAACPACMLEMPMLIELHKQYKDNKDFVMLSFSADNAERAQKFLNEHPLAYEVVPGSNDMICYDMQTSYSYPTNLIVGKNGAIVEFTIGTGNNQVELDRIKAEFTALIDRELAK